VIDRYGVRHTVVDGYELRSAGKVGGEPGESWARDTKMLKRMEWLMVSKAAERSS